MASTDTTPRDLSGNPITPVRTDDADENQGGRRHRASRKGRRGTRKMTRKGTRKQSKWMQHVMATKRAHKGKDLSEVLVIASKTYKKTGGSDSIVGGIGTGAAPVGGRKTRKSGRSRKH